MRERQPWRGNREPRRNCFSAESISTNLSEQQGFCVTKACNLFILDNGKPVARSGRKTKGRRIVSGGSLVAERMT
jgi:hypothetical protein